MKALSHEATEVVDQNTSFQGCCRYGRFRWQLPFRAKERC